MSRNKTKLVRLITDDGKILYKTGWIDFLKGVHDDAGNIYPVGFDALGNAHGTNGDPDTGKIIYEDGTETGYNIHDNYFHLVCMRVVYNKYRQIIPKKKQKIA